MNANGINWFVAIAQPNAVVEKQRLPDCALPPQTVMERLEAIYMLVRYYKYRDVRHRLSRDGRRSIPYKVWLPVMDRYLFVGSDLPADEAAAAIRLCRGISQLVPDVDGNPGIVPSADMEELDRRFRNYKAAIRYHEFPLKPGQRVRLMSGSFTGFPGDFEKADLEKGMATVIGDIFKRKVKVTLPVEDVEAL